MIVDDGTNTSVASQTVINVYEEAAPPKAKIVGGDLYASLNVPIELDGSFGHTSNDDSLTYDWKIISKPEESKTKLKKNIGAKVTFTPDVKGLYEVALTVHDGESYSKPVKSWVVVNPPRKAAYPVAFAGRNVEAYVTTTINLHGEGRGGPDGTELDYMWTVIETPPGAQIALTSLTSSNTSFYVDIKGLYKLGLTVTTSDGESSAMDIVDILVNDLEKVIDWTQDWSKEKKQEEGKIEKTASFQIRYYTDSDTKIIIPKNFIKLPATKYILKPVTYGETYHFFRVNCLACKTVKYGQYCKFTLTPNEDICVKEFEIYADRNPFGQPLRSSETITVKIENREVDYDF